MAEIGAIASSRKVWILASSLSALRACCGARVFITGSNFRVLVASTLGRLYQFLVCFLDSFVKLCVHESLSSWHVLSETSTTCSATSSSSEYLESYNSILLAQSDALPEFAGADPLKGNGLLDRLQRPSPSCSHSPRT